MQADILDFSREKSRLSNMLLLARMGLPVFPILPNSKTPPAGGGVSLKTTDPAIIRAWHRQNPDANYGVAAGAGLLVLDVDPKHGGDVALADLESRHGKLPDTLTTATPSGGAHYYFKGPDVSQRGIGTGLDIRSAGGYVVGPGSEFNGKVYHIDAPGALAEAPLWLVDLCGRPLERSVLAAVPLCELDQPSAVERAREMLELHPAVTEGRRDDAAYKAACKCKDFGLSQEKTAELVCTHLLPKLIGFSAAEAEKSVENAYTYGKRRIGANNPAAEFETVEAAGLPPWLHMRGKRPVPCADNLGRVLDRLNVTLRFDLFANQCIFERNGQTGALTDADLHSIYDRCRVEGLNVSRSDVAVFAEVVARKRSFHPILDYLASLKWDGVQRLRSAPSAIFRAPADPIYGEFFLRWMLAGITRPHRPGYKFDQILAIEGAQGIGKSEALRILGGKYFTDQMRLGADAKIIIEQTAGKWIIEIPEARGSGSEAALIKAALSASEDTARLAYGRLTSTVKRQWVAATTTNQDAYLIDTTGNRRFWPIPCRGPIDLDALRRDRDQLWAEALHLYHAGETCDLDQKWWSSAADLQAEREVSTATEECLGPLLQDQEGFVRIDDLWCALGVHSMIEKRKLLRELGETMRKLGWQLTRKRHNGMPVRVYTRGRAYTPLSWDATTRRLRPGDIVI